MKVRVHNRCNTKIYQIICYTVALQASYLRTVSRFSSLRFFLFKVFSLRFCSFSLFKVWGEPFAGLKEDSPKVN